MAKSTAMFDRLKLSLFFATMVMLTASLGGRLDARDLLRGVLYIPEETWWAGTLREC